MRALPDAVVRRRDAGRFVEHAGRRVFAFAEGAGTRTILLLHGFPASSYDWRHVVASLAPHARVVGFDFLGYGLSDKPADRVSLFEQADVAEAVAGAFGVERAFVLAHDMGDTVAAELCFRANDGRARFEIEGVALTNGSIFIDMAQLSPGQQLLLQLPDEPLEQDLPLDGFKPGVAATFSTEHQPADEELDAMLALIAHHGGDRLMPRLIRYIEERRVHQERWTAGLVGFAGPLSALWGEQDPIAVVAMTARLAELRPSTDVVTWPDVGHWPEIEVPERLAAAVLERL